MKVKKLINCACKCQLDLERLKINNCFFSQSRSYGKGILSISEHLRLKYASLTMGHRQILASVIVNVAMVTGLKSRILGYMSIGDKVWGVKRR